MCCKNISATILDNEDHLPILHVVDKQMCIRDRIQETGLDVALDSLSELIESKYLKFQIYANIYQLYGK